MTIEEAGKEIFRIRRALVTLPSIAADFTRRAKHDVALIAYAIILDDSVAAYWETRLRAVMQELESWERRRPQQ